MLITFAFNPVSPKFVRPQWLLLKHPIYLVSGRSTDLLPQIPVPSLRLVEIRLPAHEKLLAEVGYTH